MLPEPGPQTNYLYPKCIADSLITNYSDWVSIWDWWIWWTLNRFIVQQSVDWNYLTLISQRRATCTCRSYSIFFVFIYRTITYTTYSTNIIFTYIYTVLHRTWYNTLQYNHTGLFTPGLFTMLFSLCSFHYTWITCKHKSNKNAT